MAKWTAKLSHPKRKDKAVGTYDSEGEAIEAARALYDADRSKNVGAKIVLTSGKLRREYST